MQKITLEGINRVTLVEHLINLVKIIKHRYHFNRVHVCIRFRCRRGRDVKESGPDLVDFTFAKVTPNKGLGGMNKVFCLYLPNYFDLQILCTD